jgi:hypothetical protein
VMVDEVDSFMHGAKPLPWFRPSRQLLLRYANPGL